MTGKDDIMNILVNVKKEQRSRRENVRTIIPKMIMQITSMSRNPELTKQKQIRTIILVTRKNRLQKGEK